MKRFAALTFLGLSSLAWGHVRQRVYVPTSGTSGDGKESIIAWPLSSGVKVSMHQFSGNIGSGSTVTAIDFTAARAAVGAGLAQWTGNGVTLFGGLTLSLPVDLDGTLPYATTNNCERSSSSSVDGVNNVLFTSKIDTSCASSLSSSTGVIGLTRVLYDSTTGQIVEADVQFDDKEFLFKTSGSNDISVTPKEVLLSDVVTHELGHFFGLDHTSSRSSTMLFAIAEDLHTTKTDDQLGLFSL